MWCDAQFDEFNDNLKLNATRKSRIDSAISAFIQFCREDDQLSIAMSETPFLQGSVGTRTAIRPLTSDEFDVDVIYSFSLSKFGIPLPSPKNIIDWFVSRLSQRAYYAGRLKPKDRCARIDYAGDFHLDIIPSTTDVRDHQPYAVPARDLQDWITNDPLGFAAWVKVLDYESGWRDADGDGRFVRAVRMMKRWRDQFFGFDSAPSSILLMTMLGKHIPKTGYYPPLKNPLYPQYQHDTAYVYDMARLTVSCLKNPPCHAFVHPTILGDDLARGWQHTFLPLFISRLDRFCLNLGEGIFAQTEIEAVKHYKNAFGDTFPMEG